MPGGEFLGLGSTFSRIAFELFEPGTVEGTFRQIVDLAERTVERCDAAGIVLLDDDGKATTAAGSPLAAALDRMQLDADDGPGLDASTLNVTLYADNLDDDPRWPEFGLAATAAGVRSVLACSLYAAHPSALNFYARSPAAFDADDRAQAQLFATLARFNLHAAEPRLADDNRARHLTEALRTGEMIGQAQGILMELERITSNQAFDGLRRASQHTNSKLHTIAEDPVGQPPDTARNRPPP